MAQAQSWTVAIRLAHRAFKQLSTLLSKAGFHVLRFDYYGTGDSSGDSRQGTVEQWIVDIQAAKELRDAPGAKKVSLVGLRLGAALAMVSTAKDTDLADLLLWDPMVDGKIYLDRHKGMHESLLQDRFAFPVPRLWAACINEELLGFAFPGEMRAGIEQINLLIIRNCAAERVILMVSDEKEEVCKHALVALCLRIWPALKIA